MFVVVDDCAKGSKITGLMLEMVNMHIYLRQTEEFIVSFVVISLTVITEDPPCLQPHWKSIKTCNE